MPKTVSVQGLRLSQNKPSLDYEELESQKASFASSIRNCGNTKALSDGQVLHHCVLQSELCNDGFLANLLLQMYGKCGAILEALSLFSRMSHKDPFAWNFMIRAYDESGTQDDAILAIDHMLKEACLPDKHVYTSIVSACSNNKDLVHGTKMHSLIVSYGINSDPIVGANLVRMYGRCGRMKDASHVFGCLNERGPMAWTVLITAYAEFGTDNDVIQLFGEMRQDGVDVDNITFVSILSVCADKASVTVGKQMHELVLECNLGADVAVANTLVNMYGKCGSITDAWQVFCEIEERDVVTWSAMVAAFSQCGQEEDALRLFRQMYQEGFLPNRVTFISVLSAFLDQELLPEGKQLHVLIVGQALQVDVSVATAIINMYRVCGSISHALLLYKELSIRDEAANVSILTLCATYGTLSEGKEIHSLLTTIGTDNEINVSVALINMYGKCGCLHESRKTFDVTFKRDVILWNVMSATYAQNGEGVEAIGLFRQMLAEKVEPDKATYSTLLTAFSHAGLINKAYGLFVLMEKASEMKPVVDQYNCMVDLLARTGRLDTASHLIGYMPVSPTTASWLTLLSICRTQIDIVLGESSAKHVIELDPRDTGSYIMLFSNYLLNSSNSMVVGPVDSMF